jgi:putative restriction endonuclease
MRAFTAVTDNEWFRFLATQLGIDEVNFWQPSGGRVFRVLQAGEPLLFKLHSPESFVVGGGFFVRYTRLPHSMAWDVFGIKNGTATLEEMRRRIERYRRIGPSNEDYEIGCIVLAQPFFFGRDDWFPPPADFSPNVQTGKSYDLTSEPYGTQLWEDVALRTMARDLDIDMEIEESPPTMFGEPILVRPRLGQGSFRVLVTETYERRCAVTGEKVLPVLEAAHIRPVAVGGVHRIDNGLLLRSDLHTLFDKGYVTVTPGPRLRVSRHLRDDFKNGAYYYSLDGSEVWQPKRPDDQADHEALEWHADTVFKG